MTNAQPENLENRVASLEEQLEQVLDELDLLRTIQNGVRRENRSNSTNAARLERATANLAVVSANHTRDIRQMQQNINRILEYLENPNRGDTMPN